MSISTTNNPSTTERKAKPFLKWVGGKQQLLSQFEQYFPANFKRYIEPFVGGGAVFFHIAQKYEVIKHFYLIDINEDLVNCYNAIKNDVQSVIRKLKQTHGENELLEAIDVYQFLKNRGRANGPGFLIEYLRSEWSPPPDYQPNPCSERAISDFKESWSFD